MTRIIAGAARGRSLAVPRGDATRPTADRVREALFSSLQHRGWLEGTRVLDLYAGTGALGLEAASRGAAHVQLVERGDDALAACRRNAELVAGAVARADGAVSEGARPDVVVTAGSVAPLLGGAPGEPYDLVLLDPPYDLAPDALALVLDRLVERWTADDALLVVERSARSPEPVWPPGVERQERRRYGETVVWLARRTPPEPADPAEPADPG